MPLAAKLLSIAVIFVLAGRSVPVSWPLAERIGPADAVRAAVRSGRGRACPPLREQEPPGWLKALAMILLLLALSAFSLAATLL